MVGYHVRMRMMIHVSFPVEAGNTGITSGKLTALVQKFIADQKPESAYFFADGDGRRSGIMVVDMKDTSEIPGLAEPWFLGLNASFKIWPVMTPQDLVNAGPGIEKAIKGA
jgi:hypothetical protein